MVFFILIHAVLTGVEIYDFKLRRELRRTIYDFRFNYKS